MYLNRHNNQEHNKNKYINKKIDKIGYKELVENCHNNQEKQRNSQIEQDNTN